MKEIYPHPKCDAACYYICTEAGGHAPNCISITWIKSSERMPDAGDLIVKRWESGAVWAGIYSGSAKDSSFKEWILLEKKKWKEIQLRLC
jgi:hypothetical protein